MVKLQNLISRKSVPSFQKKPFPNDFQSRCSKKFTQYLQENTCVGPYFNKVPVLQASNFLKK